MKRLRAATVSLTFAALLGSLVACGGGSTPQPGLSPLTVTTNRDCEPRMAPGQPTFMQLTGQKIADALDIKPVAPIFRAPQPWDGTEKGLTTFGVDMMHSMCDMLSDIFTRAQLGGMWALRLIMSTRGVTVHDCQEGGKKLGDDVFNCFADLGGDGRYHTWILVYPLERLQLFLQPKGDVKATIQTSAGFAADLMALMYAATLKQPVSDAIATCGAGVWYQTLIKRQLATPDTIPQFASGMVNPQAVYEGIQGQSLGKCLKQHPAQEGGSPAPGTLPSGLSLPFLRIIYYAAL